MDATTYLHIIKRDAAMTCAMSSSFIRQRNILVTIGLGATAQDLIDASLRLAVRAREMIEADHGFKET